MNIYIFGAGEKLDHAEMLSRAFSKARRSRGERSQGWASSMGGPDDQFGIGGLLGEDMQLSFCNRNHEHERGRVGRCRKCPVHPTVGEVLGSSVGVMGESPMAMTEKVVLSRGKRVYAVKRFRRVSLGKTEFGRRVERVAGVSRMCQYLVPVSAYLYAKRMKFVVSDYYPMGSLADLLAGARNLGHTALDWSQRFQILVHTARAIAFIHSQSPNLSSNTKKYIQMNVHGNIKSSNVMIGVDFSARLSDYGFAQLVETKPPPVPQPPSSSSSSPSPSPASSASTSSSESSFSEKLCQKSDVYNFGIIILDSLGGPRAVGLKESVLESKEELRDGKAEFFEFSVKGKERKQAFKVLELGLACLRPSPDARPSIHHVLGTLLDDSHS